MLQVRQTAGGDPLRFEVKASDAAGQSLHAVTMAPATYQRLSAGGKYPPEQCVEAAFRFLLDREPRESILTRFDITLISRYFPEFEARLPDYLSHA
jgi:hypothetical protein